MSAHGDQLEWVRADDCESNGCVEVAAADGAILIRNSRYPDGARLSFTRQEWLEFVEGVRTGRFVVD
ncbi:DUF397 domain-containing protein [Allorhizocola rhizosphaerae]|uniref:DUF397 domain-containing protein n=1 Tax=Allorhizocola rhizosphaerae TaxID=1872709 RepID=UPI000E3C3E4F|nr:DUF397 domain-containing protein [Allorhizocola rhizosphaerae]